MPEDTDDLKEEFILEAQEAFEWSLDVSQDTEMRMTSSDHGYATWLIAPLGLIDDGRNLDELAILSIEDAGKTQRRFVLLVLSELPFMLVHTYFEDDVKTYEISHQGKINK